MSQHPTIFADTESCPEIWIRVEGKGSFQNSPALKEFARRLIEEGRRKFVVDLKNCVAMDSTFMGTLAGLAIRLRDLGGGDLWVVNRNERNDELLRGLGIDTLFSEKPLLVMHDGDCKEAIHHAADKAATREVIHEAHAACVSVDARNADKFKDVLEHLKASAARDAVK
ncbi:MAG: STAS domain-containing protein [Chthoniobacteraceae bacterium]